MPPALSTRRHSPGRREAQETSDAIRQRTTTPPLAFVVCVIVAAGVAATPGVAVGESLAATAPQEPSAVEASLALDRSTRRLIQQGLRNEGFDPAHPTACSARERAPRFAIGSSPGKRHRRDT